MRYPFVILYRYDKYNSIDTFFSQNSNELQCSIFLTNNIIEVTNLHNSNYHLLVTCGESKEEYEQELLTVISENMLVRRIHIDIKDLLNDNTNNEIKLHGFNLVINNNYTLLCASSREVIRPTFSVFTSSFNSFDKILRVYNSLEKQILLDWEWIILDDSTDDNNFTYLKEKFSGHPKIRLFKKDKNNGSIGNVKNETIGLCRGKYVLEMDHDDEILPYVLKDAADLFNSNTDIGFIYMDSACLYENGENQYYGDFICKGYGGYYAQKDKEKNKWLLVCITPNINNITLSHLTCCPNHPRIWRKSTLNAIGSYCEMLPICDDYEILIRTALGTKMAKIHKLGYIQYMNNSNNNFSLIRNAEINRIGPYYISPIYYHLFDINNYFKTKNAYEDEKYVAEHSKIWERDQSTYKHNYYNLLVNDSYENQILILGIDSLIFYKDEITSLYANKKNDFLLLDNKCTNEYLWNKLESFELDRIKCWSLIDTPTNNLINYFKLLYLTCPNYKILHKEIDKLNYNTQLCRRSDVINSLTSIEDNYLEIGTEYGTTFLNIHFTNKTGIDPDPKYTDTNTYVCTSDEYFKNNEFKYDVIFIDGMHQLEYFINDLNNSIKFLNNGGKIFIDDVLPLCYNEQLKIPIRHYYENGILKYGENWTGDIWKVVYYLLVYHIQDIDKVYLYHNVNYRGILCLTVKSHFSIELNDKIINEINNYNYFNDYSKYMQVLNTHITNK